MASRPIFSAQPAPEAPETMSQLLGGNSWVSGSSWVSGNSRVSGKSKSPAPSQGPAPSPRPPGGLPRPPGAPGQLPWSDWQKFEDEGKLVVPFPIV